MGDSRQCRLALKKAATWPCVGVTPGRRFRWGLSGLCQRHCRTRNRGRSPPVSAAVLAEKALRRHIAPRTLSRGDAYFAEGRVRRIEKVSDEAIEARVQGSELYYVTLLIDGDGLIPACTCPWFVENDEE